MASVETSTWDRLAHEVLEEVRRTELPGDVRVTDLRAHPGPHDEPDVRAIELVATLSDAPPPHYEWPGEAVEAIAALVNRAFRARAAADPATAEQLVSSFVTLAARPGAPDVEYAD